MSDAQSQIQDVVKSVRTTLVGAIEKNDQINQVFTKAEEATKVGKYMVKWIRCSGSGIFLWEIMIACLFWCCVNILYPFLLKSIISRKNIFIF